MKNSTKKKLHYTIVEMMMVIAVFMIILAMAVVAWSNSNSQTQLKNAARLVSAQLNLAKAKAVANRETVRVEITLVDNRYKLELFYGAASSGTDRPREENAIYLPRNIYLVDDLGVNSDSTPHLYANNDSFRRMSLNNNAPEIVFSASGKSNQDRRFYLMEELPTGTVRSGEVYYIITVNQFTGRVKTQLETVP